MKFEGKKEDFDKKEVELEDLKLEDKDNDEPESSPAADPFTQLMFGNRVPPRYRNQQQKQVKEEEKKSDESEVNYFTLMEQIDDIMVSLENLKPVLKQFSPIMDYIKKKI